MDEEVDLGSYVAILFRYWPWILGLAAVAALAGFLISLVLPLTFEASAFVVVTQSRYSMEFDPRQDTVELKNPQYKVFPALAGADDILQAVLDEYTPTAAARLDPWGLETLAEIVDADAGVDPSLVLLTVRSRSAADAAGIANAWANIFVRKGNEIYGQSESDVAFFTQQVTQAAQAGEAADAAMIEFQGRDRSSTVTAELEARRQAEASLLEAQNAITFIIQDIRGFRTQLAGQSAGQSGSLANQLTALLLQVKAFNAQEGAPLQFQIDTAGLTSDAALQDSTSRASAEQIALLDALLTTLVAKSEEIDAQVATSKPQILALQQELQSIQVESDRLTRARDLARETHLTLARKLEEARIAAQEEHGYLQVGSYAAVPGRPASPRRLVIAVVAGILGLVAGVVGVFGREAWRNPTGSPPPT